MDSMRKPSWHCFVRINEIPLFELCGYSYTPALEGTGHGYYSAVMEWEHLTIEPIPPACIRSAIQGDLSLNLFLQKGPSRAKNAA